MLRHDTPTLLFLLPYIVHGVVCYGTDEDRSNVLAEILAVLEEAGQRGQPGLPARAAEGGASAAMRSELSAQVSPGSLASHRDLPHQQG